MPNRICNFYSVLATLLFILYVLLKFQQAGPGVIVCGIFLKYLTLMFQLTQNFTAQKFHIFSTASLSIARFSLFIINIFLSIFSPFTLKLFSFQQPVLSLSYIADYYVIAFVSCKIESFQSKLVGGGVGVFMVNYICKIGQRRMGFYFLDLLSCSVKHVFREYKSI